MADYGRWLGRDPIGEDGGINLYGFVENGVLDNWDILGLWKKVSGTSHTYCADSEFDTLRGLAAKYGDADSWSCLWPVQGTKDNGYSIGKVAVGDKYDASNLAKISIPNKLYITVNSKRLNRGGAFNITFRYVAGSKLVDELKKVSGEGKTPISELLVYGHSWDGWLGMSGDHKADRKKGDPTYDTFFLSDLTSASKSPKFERAKDKKGPLRCWFARDSSVRLAGCKTYRLALHFSMKVLRKGSISWGTKHSISTNPLTNTLTHYADEGKGKKEDGRALGTTGRGAGIHSKTWTGYPGSL